jgi:hypothetical protein
MITVTYMEERSSKYKKKREKKERQSERAIGPDEQVNEKIPAIRSIQVEPRKKRQDEAARVRTVR